MRPRHRSKVPCFFKGTHFHSIFFFTVLLAGAIPFTTYGQDEGRERTIQEMKRLSLEELMNLQVTSVTKHPEKLIETH